MAESRKFMEAEKRYQGGYSSTIGNTLFQAYRPFMGWAILWVSLGFLGRLALLANANIIGYWVDSYCKAPLECRPQPSFFAGFQAQDFVMALALTTATGFILSAFFRVGFSRLSAHAVSRIYDETTLRTSRLPMKFFDRNPAGRVMTRFSSDYNNVFRIFGGPLSEFLSLIFDLVGMSVLILFASPWYAPFWILIGIMNFGVYRYNLASLRRERRELAHSRSPSISHFAESAQGASTIRSFRREDSFVKRFSTLNDHYLVQRLRTMKVMAGFGFQMGALTSTVFLLTAFAGVHLISSGRVSVGSIGVAFTYIGLSSHILQAFFEWLAQFEEALTGLERLNEYLRLPMEAGASLPATARFQTGHPQRGAFGEGSFVAPHAAEVEIQNLWFRYGDGLPPVLQGIDLTIRAGERIAIVGRTGSGKTSLIQALYRMYPIEKGVIRIGGFEPLVTERAMESSDGVQEVDLLSYRSMIALISQEPTLFLGTIRDNLTEPGKYADEALMESLRRVQYLPATSGLDEWQRLLDSPVEERGRNLSAGERQLICMARCLLQDAPVVVLDEATSAVDPESEHIMNQATARFFSGKTQILIAHRLSTIRHCDRVLWLKEGRIHRLGPPSEVLPEFESQHHVRSMAPL